MGAIALLLLIFAEPVMRAFSDDQMWLVKERPGCGSWRWRSRSGRCASSSPARPEGRATLAFRSS
ncbi:MAG: hypothetical protein WKH64_07305 [Chloroflexia bacterium]